MRDQAREEARALRTWVRRSDAGRRNGVMPRSPEGQARIAAANRRRAKPVEAVDLETGGVVKRYATVKDVEQDGHSRAAVASCCKSVGSRHRRTHHGLYWRWANAGQ